MFLEIKNLTVDFETGEKPVRAVDGVSLSIEAGEIIGLVGEAGSGKTTLGLAITRLVPEPPAAIRSGQVLFGGKDLLRVWRDALYQTRGGEIAYIFQEPSTSLNPVMTVGAQHIETLELHTAHRGAAARQQAIASLKQVVIPAPEERLRNYP